MTGIPYGIEGERFDTSRTYYHEFGKKAERVPENLRESERVIVLNKAFRERLVAAPTCHGISAANITAIAEEVFTYSISGGTIWNILKGSGGKGRTYRNGRSFSKRRACSDGRGFGHGMA